MSVKVLYFARLREVFGRAEEEIEAASVGELLDRLVARGGSFAEELAGRRPFRVAVNQTLAERETLLASGDEVAIFPPVTGG